MGAFLHEPVKGKGATWNLILMDCWEKWLGFPDLITEARKMMQETRFKRRTKPLFTPLVGPGFAQDEIKKADLLVIEERGSGISLRQMLCKEGIDLVPVQSGKGRQAEPVACRVSYRPARAYLDSGDGRP